jgi:hypothetical protein
LLSAACPKALKNVLLLLMKMSWRRFVQFFFTPAFRKFNLLQDDCVVDICGGISSEMIVLVGKLRHFLKGNFSENINEALWKS